MENICQNYRKETATQSYYCSLKNSFTLASQHHWYTFPVFQFSSFRNSLQDSTIKRIMIPVEQFSKCIKRKGLSRLEDDLGCNLFHAKEAHFLVILKC